MPIIVFVIERNQIVAIEFSLIHVLLVSIKNKIDTSLINEGKIYSQKSSILPMIFKFKKLNGMI
jgi:hypothetical protein